MKIRMFQPVKPRFLLGVMDGGSLERRVLRLMDGRIPWAGRWRVASAMVCVAVMAAASSGVGMLAVRASVAQAATGAGKIAFEVATIKPNNDASGDSGSTFSRNEYAATNRTLIDILRSAYGLTSGGSDRVSGGPSWIYSTRFDIKATLGDADYAEMQKLDRDQSQERTRLLLQTLLEDRFKLKVHHETRDLPVYVLTIAKNGAKLTQSSPADAQGQHGVRTGRGQIIGTDTKFDTFVNILGMQSEIGRRVVDKTGLAGSYDFTLRWTPQSMADGDSSAPPDSAGPSLFTALQEQLGLKLELSKGPTDTIVIDSVEMPTEN